jgi:hypothetical protein
MRVPLAITGSAICHASPPERGERLKSTGR